MGQVWGLLNDEDRLRVFAALALGDRTITAIADRSGVSARSVVKALSRLAAGGVVAGEGNDWELRRDVIADRARVERPAGPSYDGVPDRDASVLRAFLRDGRLVSIPAVRSKRVVVLDHLARVFDPGVRYPEREVDALLRVFHPDHAALRRHLVDEGFLAREAGIYWRSGGTVPAA